MFRFESIFKVLVGLLLGLSFAGFMCRNERIFIVPLVVLIALLPLLSVSLRVWLLSLPRKGKVGAIQVFRNHIVPTATASKNAAFAHFRANPWLWMAVITGILATIQLYSYFDMNGSDYFYLDDDFWIGFWLAMISIGGFITHFKKWGVIFAKLRAMFASGWKWLAPRANKFFSMIFGIMRGKKGLVAALTLNGSLLIFIGMMMYVAGSENFDLDLNYENEDAFLVTVLGIICLCLAVMCKAYPFIRADVNNWAKKKRKIT